MTKEEDQNKDIDQSAIIEVTPVDSPSENSLVTEHLQRMPSIFSRGLVYLIVLILAVALVYSILGEMDIVAECQAVARPVTHIARVQSDRTGYIEKIYISEGQEVEKDEPLFLIRSRDSVEHRLEVNRLKLEQNKSTLASIESELSFWRKEVTRLTQDHRNLQNLYKSGIVSNKDVSDAKSNLEKARTEERKLRARRDITLNENKILEEQMEQTTEESEKTIAAEDAGVISELYFRNQGEYVRESDLLCTIVPAGSPLYMDITVANKDIGFIEEDMDIKYKFEAFPYQDYGILSGKVSTISATAVEEPQRGFFYHVQGELKTAHFEIKGKTYMIKSGMTAVAEIVTEKKNIFSLLFKKFRGA